MEDFAQGDKRSVKAMLNGTGDARENIWLEYEADNQNIRDKLYLFDSFEYKARRGLLPRRTLKEKHSITKNLKLLVQKLLNSR